jgi:hypothetical protein
VVSEKLFTAFSGLSAQTEGMGKYFKVIDIERNLFEGHSFLTIPKAFTPREISRRRSEGPGSAGRRAEHLALQRYRDVLTSIPVTDLRTFKRVTSDGANALIGSAVCGLFPEETAGKEPENDRKRMRKPVCLAKVLGRDEWDPEQRATSNDVLDMAAEKLAVAANMAEALIDQRGMSEDDIRNQTIALGRLEGGIAMDLASWQLADQLAYEEWDLSPFETMSRIREQGIAQKQGAVAMAGALSEVASIRALALDHTRFTSDLYLAGHAALTGALQASSHLVLPN